MYIANTFDKYHVILEFLLRFKFLSSLINKTFDQFKPGVLDMSSSLITFDMMRDVKVRFGKPK
jgi:hypothetical protein